MSESIVEEYSNYMTSRGYAAASVRNRLSYIRRLVADVDVYTVEAWPLEEWIFSHGWKPESLNGAITCIRRFFQWMRRSGRRTDDPGVELKTVPLRRRKPRVADDDALAAGLAKAIPMVQLMIRLAAECGMRRHEIAKARRADLNGDRLRIVGKGGRERFVYVSAEVLELLDQLPTTGWVFPARVKTGHRGHTPELDTDHHLSPESVGQYIRTATGLNAHSLRHRAATIVYQGTGHDIRLTQEFLGHASPEMTARYVHVNEDDLRRAGQVATLRGLPWAAA